MATKRHTAEQIVRKLREAEVELAKGSTVKDACRKLGVTEHTYYRWRREYGGLKLNQAKRLKQLEKENLRLKKLVEPPRVLRRPFYVSPATTAGVC